MFTIVNKDSPEKINENILKILATKIVRFHEINEKCKCG